MQHAAQTRRSAKKNVLVLSCFCGILAFILAPALRPAVPESSGDNPPPDLVQKVAAQESGDDAARDHYTYRQTVTLDELDNRGLVGGEYKEVRDVVFSPSGKRSEDFVGKPWNGLQRLQLTDEDFRDLREVQPFLLTTDSLFLYDTHFRGDEDIDGASYWVIQIEPKQILQGQRLFDGLIWVDKNTYSIVRCEGQAEPQIRTMQSENLFPHFTTLRAKIDGKHWFPVETYADDILPFRNGPVHIHLKILYSQYKRFEVDSTIQYKKE